MSSSDGLNGQWIGTYGGSSQGTIMVNVDERNSNYQGVAYLFSDDIRLPGTAVAFRTQDKSRELVSSF